ncbi:MAG: hypothetical protein NUW09_01440 [Deltaproteobacteria bacterium]|nr:hypothetical protein [Deltaproteobacteria bacterium]
MKKFTLPTYVFLLLIGCAAMLPPIETQHPDGYSRLKVLQPECATINLDNYGACLAASELLESTSPEQATVKFLKHWEDTAFGFAQRKAHIGEARYSPQDSFLESGVWGSVRAKGINFSEKIVVPVLKNFYADKNDDYSVEMLKQLNLIMLDSRSSFDTFREVHAQILKNRLIPHAPPPPAQN